MSNCKIFFRQMNLRGIIISGLLMMIESVSALSPDQMNDRACSGLVGPVKSIITYNNRNFDSYEGFDLNGRIQGRIKTGYTDIIERPVFQHDRWKWLSDSACVINDKYTDMEYHIDFYELERTTGSCDYYVSWKFDDLGRIIEVNEPVGKKIISYSEASRFPYKVAINSYKKNINLHYKIEETDSMGNWIEATAFVYINTCDELSNDVSEDCLVPIDTVKFSRDLEYYPSNAINNITDPGPYNSGKEPFITFFNQFVRDLDFMEKRSLCDGTDGSFEALDELCKGILPDIPLCSGIDLGERWTSESCWLSDSKDELKFFMNSDNVCDFDSAGGSNIGITFKRISGKWYMTRFFLAG